MHPILFHWGNQPIYAYSFFTGLAILVGAVVYFKLTSWKATTASSSPILLEKRIMLWTGAFIGGFLGAKFFDILINYQLLLDYPDLYLQQQIGGRTVLGGLIGGYVGVKIVKYFLGMKEKTGDPFALALSLAMGIGRIGCYLGGCCYGKATESWFSVFMEGQHRYPTQLLEMAFDFSLFVLLWMLRNQMKKPGDLFKLFIFSYATFRFFIEFIRTEPVIWLGLTFYQLLALPLVVLTGGYFFKYYFKAKAGNIYAG